MKKIKLTVVLLISFLFLICGCSQTSVNLNNESIRNESVIQTEDIPVTQNKDEKVTESDKQKEINDEVSLPKKSFNPSEIPAYSGKAYAVINSNQPYFSEADYKTTSFELYSELDSLRRCGVAYANIGKDIMPTEERESIGSVKPSGWQTAKYDMVDGKYLYNRCHLIGFQLSGENANEKNLITGTRYMNVQGMLPFENMVADYVKETNNHVLLRVTPVFEANNLVATGVLMEAFSVEDEGDGICFNVFCYNVQPGITIDYSNGASKLTDGKKSEVFGVPVTTPEKEESSPAKNTYIGNKNTKKFHYPSCSGAQEMKESNKVSMNCTREEALNKGYSPCKNCNP